MVLDRDQNAALNLLHEAVKITGSSSGMNACGQGSSGRLKGAGETALDEAGTKHCLGMS
jgi:putative transposase